MKAKELKFNILMKINISVNPYLLIKMIVLSYIENAKFNGSIEVKNKETEMPKKLEKKVEKSLENIEKNRIEPKKNIVQNVEEKNVDIRINNCFVGATKNNLNEMKNKWDEFKEVNNKSNVSQALGFKFDTSKVSIELEDVNTVLEEFTRSLYTGLVDTDEYVSKLINKLESAGIDKVKEELERQLNDWKIKKQTF